VATGETTYVRYPATEREQAARSAVLDVAPNVLGVRADCIRMERSMSEENLTVHILRELREEIRSTRDELRSEIRATNQRVDHLDRELRAEIAATRHELKTEILASEVRLATRFAEQTAATRDLHDLLNANLQLRDRVERCEHDIVDLKGRVH
jgi:chromosome segregation ATPase